MLDREFRRFKGLTICAPSTITLLMDATQNSDSKHIAYCAARAAARTFAMYASILASEGKAIEAESFKRQAAEASARANRLAATV